MNICPFWSNKKEKVNCFDDCAFALDKEEKCPFKLYLDDSGTLLSIDKEYLTYAED